MLNFDGFTSAITESEDKKFDTVGALVKNYFKVDPRTKVAGKYAKETVKGTNWEYNFPFTLVDDSNEKASATLSLSVKDKRVGWKLVSDSNISNAIKTISDMIRSPRWFKGHFGKSSQPYTSTSNKLEYDYGTFDIANDNHYEFLINLIFFIVYLQSNNKILFGKESKSHVPSMRDPKSIIAVFEKVLKKVGVKGKSHMLNHLTFITDGEWKKSWDTLKAYLDENKIQYTEKTDSFLGTKRISFNNFQGKTINFKLERGEQNLEIITW